jgi:hypothetical protein
MGPVRDSLLLLASMAIFVTLQGSVVQRDGRFAHFLFVALI